MKRTKDRSNGGENGFDKEAISARSAESALDWACLYLSPSLNADISPTPHRELLQGDVQKRRDVAEKEYRGTTIADWASVDREGCYQRESASFSLGSKRECFDCDQPESSEAS